MKNLVPLLVFAAVVFVVFGDKLGQFVPNLGGVSSVGEVFPDQPTDSKVAAAVEPVKTILKTATPEEKLSLARLWREEARLIGLDDAQGVIKSTADIRAAHGMAGKLMALNIKGKYPGLADAVDKAIMDVVGNQSRSLDAGVRKDAVAVLNGLSWAARN